MAASVNNIAATFAATSTKSSATASVSVRPISASAAWNPHSALPRSFRSSLLRLYGPPGPLPHLRGRNLSPLRGGPNLAVGSRLPDAVLSYLDRDSIRTVSLRDVTRGTKSVILSATAAFAPPPLSGGARRLVEKASLMRVRGADVVACVAANDVYVMGAWGESLGAGEAAVMMLSDPDAELAGALGVAVDARGGAHGLGVRSDSFCMVVADEAVKAVFGGGGGGRWDFDDVIKAL